jgi:hypothetical protein
MFMYVFDIINELLFLDFQYNYNAFFLSYFRAYTYGLSSDLRLIFLRISVIATYSPVLVTSIYGFLPLSDNIFSIS